MTRWTFETPDPALALALQEALARILGAPLVTDEGRVVPPEDLKSDELQLAQLLLTLPIAAVATWSLVDRLQVGETLRRLAAWAEGRGIRLRFGGRSVDLSELDPAELLTAVDDVAHEQTEAPVWDVFLSYASPDRERVAALAEALRNEGLRVFRDRDHLAVGEVWNSGLWNAQRTAHATVLALSSHWSGAFWQQEELMRGIALYRKHDHGLFPVYLDGVPDEVAEVPPGLAILQSLDAQALGSPEAVARAIAEALRQ
ncbi:MAG: toll/interleukin-1 receptor domain-containing protein [Myxococcota bacterium]